MTRFQTTASNLLISALAASTSRVASARSAGEPMGNAECPCLPSSYFRHHDRFQSHETIAAFESTLGKSVDPEKYGIGCLPHDEGTSQCSDAGGCSSLVPLPPDCDKSYCRRSWCFVDPDNCSLLNNPSELFDGGRHHYSYATCGELDLFTHTERLKSLKGKTFRVAYARNSGGWKGAYNPAGSFAVNEQWTGPIVDFVREAALEAGFVVKMTEPPPWLRPKSREFFGNGTFDSCVYAVSLGYLDFCVGGFSITGKRSSITAMFETTSDPLYLVVYADGGGETSWESFLKTTLTVFQPFTAAAWLMIFAFCLPILGLLMLFHEYGAPGSAYPEEEALCVKGRRKQPAKVEIRRIPLTKHALDSLYMGTLSFFQGSYDQSVVTTGGKINLLAIASFVMLILAVYTANLAAILTNDASAVSVDSVEMAVRQGMNICAERKVASMLMDTYGIDASKIVPDPIDLGGDGKPGFDCPACDARERIFESMRRSHADPTRYCHVAVASQEDLDVQHRYGNHCDKVRIGDTVAYRSIGIPIHDDHADALVSLFHKTKADGVMTRALGASAPQSQCPIEGGEGSALNVQQLTGVFVVTFSLVLVGLAVTFTSNPSRRCYFGGGGARRQKRSKARRTEQKLRRYDQWGNPPPNDVVVDGYRYDAEANELQEVCAGVAVDETHSVRTPDDGGEGGALGSPAISKRGISLNSTPATERGSVFDSPGEVSQVTQASGRRVSARMITSASMDLAREVPVLHKTMDLLLEQNAQIKQAIIAQQRNNFPMTSSERFRATAIRSQSVDEIPRRHDYNDMRHEEED